MKRIERAPNPDERAAGAEGATRPGFACWDAILCGFWLRMCRVKLCEAFRKLRRFVLEASSVPHQNRPNCATRYSDRRNTTKYSFFCIRILRNIYISHPLSFTPLNRPLNRHLMIRSMGIDRYSDVLQHTSRRRQPLCQVRRRPVQHFAQEIQCALPAVAQFIVMSADQIALVQKE